MGSPLGVRTSISNGVIAFVVGESQEFGEEAESIFAAVEDLFLGLRVVDVEIVGGLEQADVFFDEEQIAVENIVHATVPSAEGLRWREKSCPDGWQI